MRKPPELLVMLAPAALVTALVVIFGFVLGGESDDSNKTSAEPSTTVSAPPSQQPSGSPTASSTVPGRPEGSTVQKKLVGPTVTIKRKPKPKYDVAPQFSFTIASFNLLGHSHTAPGGDRKGMAPSGVRTGLAVGALRNSSVDLVGFQEFQAPQMGAFLAQTGGSYGVYPPASAGVQLHANAVAWRTDTFNLVQSETFGIPYFFGQIRQMPVVQLEHIATGQKLWLMNVHNPANAHGNAAKWRGAATQVEIDLANQLAADHPDEPVFLTGDMNDWEGYFCRITTSTGLKAANGGSTGSSCAPPPRPLAVDWVFGSDKVEFSDYRALRTPDIQRASDHPLVAAEVTVPELRTRIIYKDGKRVDDD
ncbi:MULTISPECIES: endonuclease/exonuclease/phosphatase family protein [unclassified Nocardioides]|uniref:endonuclease/exonuclease/phosphatase family protein n=1 Tax=unclassified Nocardioides TaxID=2615069 RepID=UPI0006F505D5|nr:MULTISPECIES: endonuclease/exonuclease/phosphatase family protein [unclassified Nocardioides]KQY57574.1 hypothetical protein ASD30_15485 [Nocardioides sp. Root140]KQZ76057.1 hypothetical protein ASD66_07160 [Nocardioides sp. Root151]